MSSDDEAKREGLMVANTVLHETKLKKYSGVDLVFCLCGCPRYGETKEQGEEK